MGTVYLHTRDNTLKFSSLTLSFSKDIIAEL